MRVGKSFRQALEKRVNEPADGARRQTRESGVDRHHSSGVHRLLILGRKDLQLGPLQNQSAAAKTRHARLPMENDLASRGERRTQIRLIEEDDPDGAGVILYQSLEDRQTLRACSAAN